MKRQYRRDSGVEVGGARLKLRYGAKPKRDKLLFIFFFFFNRFSTSTALTCKEIPVAYIASVTSDTLLL